MKQILLITTLLFISTLGIGQTSSFEINFKSGKFTPQQTIDFQEATKAQLFKNDQKYVYRLVQFYAIPKEVEKQKIKESGIELLSFISNKAYIAKIKKNVNPRNISDFNIRSISTVDSQFKISPELTKNTLPAWAVNGDKIKLNIKYYSAADLKDLTEFVTHNDGKVLVQLEKANAMTIQFSADKINTLADFPLIQWIECISRPGSPDGIISNNTSRSNTLNSNYIGGRKYDGTGVVVGLSDDGAIGPHIDQKGRVTLHTSENTGSHADNTSGIFTAAGNLDPKGRGAAPGAEIQVFRHIPNGSLESHPHIFNGLDHLENLDMVITSTSWSQGERGIYDITSGFADNQLFENQNMMHVFSAGNEGERDHDYGAGLGWANITGGYKAAKNVICVGNVNADGSEVMSSGKGPAADGRIKPDLCAQGEGSYTTDESNNYGPFGGTSAAAPAVAGLFTQLYHAYKELNNGVEPETGLLKAALLNTAKDLGNPGPDFKFGWGLVNGLKAVRVLEDKRYLRDSIGQAETNSHSIDVPENVSEVRIMTYWTEESGNPISSISLVNDIDMQVISPDTDIHNPWVLDHTPDPTALDADAIQSVDHINNMEQVSISNPSAGAYTVNLSGFAIPEGPQVYYVVYEFIHNTIELTYPIGGEGFAPGETELIRWDASQGTENFSLAYSIDDGATYMTISDAISSSASQYNWNIPNELPSNTKLRLSRGNQVSESTSPFTIVDTPQNFAIEQVCPSGIELAWDAIPGVSTYEISVLGEKYMDSLGISDTNSFTATGLNPTEERWFSVRALVEGGKGRRAIAIRQNSGLFNCNVMVDLSIEILNDQATLSPCTDLENTIISTLLTNNGADNIQDDFDISYQLNNGDVITETYSGSLMSGEQLTYDFTTPLNVPISGIHTLYITVNLNGDQNEFNNESSLDFFGASDGASELVEDFELDGITPRGWSIVNSDNDITWVAANSILGLDESPSTAAYFDNWAYDATGEEDELISGYYDLTNVSSGSKLRFDLAKAQWDPNLQDGLRVEISIDCGDSFTSIYEKDDLQLSTLPNYSNVNFWSPTSASDWRTEEIDLSPFLGEVVLFKFVNINGFGNSTFIDNIGISGSIQVGVAESNVTKFKLYPNPSSEFVNLSLSEQTDAKATVLITNRLGQKITSFNMEGQKSTRIDVANYIPGLYFVTVTTNGEIGTSKFIVN